MFDFPSTRQKQCFALVPVAGACAQIRAGRKRATSVAPRLEMTLFFCIQGCYRPNAQIPPASITFIPKSQLSTLSLILYSLQYIYQIENITTMKLPALLLAFADPSRLRILNLLAQSPLCVQHLQRVLDAPQVAVSKQLLVLKDAGLVVSEKVRTWRLYCLSPALSGTEEGLMAWLQESHAEEVLLLDDLARLKSVLPEVRPFLLRSRRDSGSRVKSAATFTARIRPKASRGPVLEEPPVLEDHLL